MISMSGGFRFAWPDCSPSAPASSSSASAFPRSAFFGFDAMGLSGSRRRRPRNLCRKRTAPLGGNVRFGMVNGLLRSGLALGKFCLVDACSGMNCPAAGWRDFHQLSVLTKVLRVARRLQAMRWATAWESWWHNADDGAAGRAGPDSCEWSKDDG